MPLAYEELVTSIKDRYGSRITAILTALKTDLIENGGLIVEGPDEAHDEEYCWSIGGWVPGISDEPTEDALAFDARIEIVESAVRGEPDAEHPGVTFSLSITGFGGEIIGGLSPYNYTDRVWVDATDEEEVEERFKILEDAEISEATALILEWLERKKEKTIRERLEYLRGEIRAERISYGELAELQGLAAHIDLWDDELLEWAGVPEEEVNRRRREGETNEA